MKLSFMLLFLISCLSAFAQTDLPLDTLPFGTKLILKRDIYLPGNRGWIDVASIIEDKYSNPDIGKKEKNLVFTSTNCRIFIDYRIQEWFLLKSGGQLTVTSVEGRNEMYFLELRTAKGKNLTLGCSRRADYKFDGIRITKTQINIDLFLEVMDPVFDVKFPKSPVIE